MANKKAYHKAAIYCRVASPGPMTRELLDVQRQRLERYAVKHHIEIVGTYEDSGYPGNTLERPGLQALMREAAHKTFDTVLVVSRDRLFRAPGPSAISKELRTPPFKIQAINELTQER